MADPDNYPELEQSESLDVNFLFAHPKFTNLAIALGPFFRWMIKHDNTPAGDVTFGPVTSSVSVQVASYSVGGQTYPLYLLPDAPGSTE